MAGPGESLMQTAGGAVFKTKLFTLPRIWKQLQASNSLNYATHQRRRTLSTTTKGWHVHVSNRDASCLQALARLATSSCICCERHLSFLHLFLARCCSLC